MNSLDFGDSSLAVEVAMGNNPCEIRHVEKHLDRFDSAWVACRNKEILEGLKQRVNENELDTDRVVFRLFREFNNVEEFSL